MDLFYQTYIAREDQIYQSMPRRTVSYTHLERLLNQLIRYLFGTVQVELVSADPAAALTYYSTQGCLLYTSSFPAFFRSRRHQMPKPHRNKAVTMAVALKSPA